MAKGVGVVDNKQSEFMDIPTESIRLSKFRVRSLQENSLGELSSSIGQHGMIEPVLLRPRKGSYEIVAGMRRFLAARRLGLKTIPARVQKLSDSEAFELLMVENLQREDFTPIETASLLKHAVKKLGYSQRQLADKIGKDE